MNSTKIDVRSLERSFQVENGKQVRALGPVDIQVRDGEFLCVVGPSGCGKSTLLRVLAGLINPSKGEATIAAGQRSGSTPMAMVFQDYSIYPWKTVLENVRFGLDLSGVKKREGSERAMHWIARLDLSEFAQAYPDKLSGGMRQRVSIARALATDPEVIFMDEPFAALDPQLREMLQDTLLEICQQEQRTVVFITHSLEEAIVLGDRVIVMTARPGTVKLEVEIPFPRPRSPEIRDTPEFGALRADLWRILRGEVEEYLQSLHEETER